MHACMYSIIKNITVECTRVVSIEVNFMLPNYYCITIQKFYVFLVPSNCCSSSLSSGVNSLTFSYAWESGRNPKFKQLVAVAEVLGKDSVFALCTGTLTSRDLRRTWSLGQSRRSGAIIAVIKWPFGMVWCHLRLQKTVMPPHNPMAW